MGFLKAVVLFLRGHFLGRHLDRRVSDRLVQLPDGVSGKDTCLVGPPAFQRNQLVCASDVDKTECAFVVEDNRELTTRNLVFHRRKVFFVGNV